MPSTATWTFLDPARATRPGIAASSTSTPFCSSRRPTKPNSAASGSTGRPSSAWRVSLATALPSATVEASNSSGSSEEGAPGAAAAGVLRPLTMPSTPTERKTSSSSTPPAGSAQISLA